MPLWLRQGDCVISVEKPTYRSLSEKSETHLPGKQMRSILGFYGNRDRAYSGGGGRRRSAGFW
jgi:hypothetical protein